MTNDNVEPHRNTTPTQPAMTMREIRQALGHTTTSPNYITTLDQTRSELRATIKEFTETEARAAGHMSALPTPFGCAVCGIAQHHHGLQATTAGIHTWQRPADAQVKARMLARRAARVSAENTPLSPEFLARLRELADAATPGPWCTDSWEIYQGTEYQPGISEWIGETCRGRVEGLAQDKADASFVAAAREAVPALLAEVERLKAELDEVCRLGLAKATCHGQDKAQLVRERDEARARVAELEQQTDAESLPTRWAGAVTFPDDDGETVVCCTTDTGHRVALRLDDEHREALGLALLLPDGDGELVERDAHRAEVLREAASVADGGHEDDCGCGGCADCVSHQIARKLREMATEAGGSR